MTFKRIISFILCLTLVIVIIPDIKSYADIVVPSDDDTHYYVYNHIDFTTWNASELLTVDNYNNYYDALSGTEKTSVTNKFIDNSENSYYIGVVNDLLICNYEVSTGINASGISFTPIVVNNQVIPFEDCKGYIGVFFNGSIYYLTLYLYYCPDNTDFTYSGNHVYNSSPYYFTYTPYRIYNFELNNEYHNYYVQGSVERFSVLSKDGNYYTNPTNSQLYTIYVDFPYLFTSNTLTGITDDLSSYEAYLNDTYDYAIDRRTELFINKISSETSDNNDIVQDGFDPKLFEGELGFNSFNASASLNYNSNTDLYEPYFDIKYQPNNYTEINLEDITLYYQAEVFMKLTLSKNMTSFYYTSTRYKTSGQGSLDRSGTSPNANRYEFILYAMNNPPLGNASWNNTSTRSSAGLYTQFGVAPFGGNNIDADISLGVSAYKHNNYVVVPSETEALSMIQDFLAGKQGNESNKSYGYYKIQLYIKNNVTGDVSTTYSSIFDLFGNKISDNSISMINNDDQAYNDFVNDFYYLDKDGNLTPVDYADRINSYGGNSSVGDITINQNPYPYVLVDIPENEWMSYTPNLRTLLTEFKSMLSEVHDESVLKMLPETYNYFPAPFMQYMLYGVGLIVMIGIWRAITRR